VLVLAKMPVIVYPDLLNEMENRLA
jgi:hypothetical protein